MPIQLLAPEDVVSGDFGRWGIYGKNGRGKTWLARSIPPNLPTLVVSCDQENVKPLRGLRHVRVVKLSEWDDIGEVLQQLQYGFDGRYGGLKTKGGLYLPGTSTPDPDVLSGKRPFFRVVIFDTWSRVQALAVNMVIGYKRLTPADAIKFISKPPKTPKGWDAWQTVGALSGEWMRYFEELPIHCLFLFQESVRDVETIEQGKIRQVGPLLTPMAAQHAYDTLELIGRLYVTLGDSGAPEEDDEEAEDDEEEDDDDLAGEVSGTKTTVYDPWMSPKAEEVRNLFIGQHPNYFAKGPTHKLGRIVKAPDFTTLLETLEL